MHARAGRLLLPCTPGTTGFPGRRVGSGVCGMKRRVGPGMSCILAGWQQRGQRRQAQACPGQQALGLLAARSYVPAAPWEAHRAAEWRSRDIEWRTSHAPSTACYARSIPLLSCTLPPCGAQHVSPRPLHSTHRPPLLQPAAGVTHHHPSNRPATLFPSPRPQPGGRGVPRGGGGQHADAQPGVQPPRGDAGAQGAGSEGARGWERVGWSGAGLGDVRGCEAAGGLMAACGIKLGRLVRGMQSGGDRHAA